MTQTMEERLVAAAQSVCSDDGNPILTRIEAKQAVDAILAELSAEARELDHVGARALMDRKHGAEPSEAKQAALDGIEYRYGLGDAQTVRVAMIDHVRAGK